MKVRLIVPRNWQSPGVPSGEQVKYSRTFPDSVEYWGKAIADIAGGFTATEGIGGWKNDRGKLIREPVTVFDIYANTGGDVVSENIFEGRMIDLARRIAVELEQDCIYLEVNGRVYFVKPDKD